jgi:lipopolysaccharide/colanic/teichoic acid biosynthesis glycosyltransferase
MHKFRTMHIAATSASLITAANDGRVFPFGRILRTLKIDELPQLFNVLIGQMSIVGPRPEDPAIVQRYFGPLGLETLTVRPGLASPGSVYNYTHGELLIDAADPETSYVNRLLPIKLALELVYVRHQSLLRDAQVILRTATTIAMISIGKNSFADPPEMPEAQTLLATARSQLVNSTSHLCLDAQKMPACVERGLDRQNPNKL